MACSSNNNKRYKYVCEDAMEIIRNVAKFMIKEAVPSGKTIPAANYK